MARVARSSSARINLTEADRLCDRIGIFKSHLIEVDTSENLREKFYGRRVVFSSEAVEIRPGWKQVRGLAGVKDAQAMDQKLVVGLDDPEALNPQIIRLLVEGRWQISNFVGELRHSLEEILYSKLCRNLKKRRWLHENTLKTIIRKEWSEVF